MQTDKSRAEKSEKKDVDIYTPPKGRVYINEARCKGCAYCVNFCPANCLIMSGRLNNKGYNLPELKYPEKCTGCNMCGLHCPDFAIFGERIKKKGEETKK